MLHACYVALLRTLAPYPRSLPYTLGSHLVVYFPLITRRPDWPLSVQSHHVPRFHTSVVLPTDVVLCGAAVSLIVSHCHISRGNLVVGPTGLPQQIQQCPAAPSRRNRHSAKFQPLHGLRNSDTCAFGAPRPAGLIFSHHSRRSPRLPYVSPFTYNHRNRHTVSPPLLLVQVSAASCLNCSRLPVHLQRSPPTGLPASICTFLVPSNFAVST